MTRIEKFGTIENYLQECAKHELKNIEKDGIKYYAERYYKHIDLLSYPEVYMTDKEKEEKQKALARVELLKEREKGNVTPSSLELYLWQGSKDMELSSWGWEIDC
jgi:hypothetical protein